MAAGAVPYLVELLKCENGGLRDSATAAILTLSASPSSKPVISASGALPLLVQILSTGSVQGKVDAVTALYYLSTSAQSLMPCLATLAVPPLLSLLRDSKKHTKFAEKTTALLEIFSEFEEGKNSITASDSGILTLVETIEDGSLISAEHAVGALLALCQSCRSKYRELILKEGAIPGLLQLTAHGTPKAQERAHMLLELLRDSPSPRKLDASVIKSIVYDIAKQVENAEKAAETATKLLQEMVQRSMEIKMNGMHLNTDFSKLQNGANG